MVKIQIMLLLSFALLFSDCNNKSQCSLSEVSYGPETLYPDWPFLSKPIFTANTNPYDTISYRDSSGIVKKGFLSVYYKSEFNENSCPMQWGEIIQIGYFMPDLSLYSPGLFFETMSIFDPQNHISNLQFYEMPVRKNYYYNVNCMYDSKSMNFIKFFYDPGRVNTSDSLSKPKNGVKIDSITSLGKTYYNVWKIDFVLNNYPLGYKTAYIDPKYGLVRYDLNNGNYFELEPYH